MNQIMRCKCRILRVILQRGSTLYSNFIQTIHPINQEMCQMERFGNILVTIVILTMFGCGFAVIEDSDHDLVAANFPYGRGVDSDQLQLARIILFPQRMCHAKRNSELINSLLSLPKNMNNVGK